MYSVASFGRSDILIFMFICLMIHLTIKEDKRYIHVYIY